MTVFITTVAGVASRFNRDLNTPTPKCIFYKQDPKATLLYGLLDRARDCDRLIAVGGYQYEALKAYAETHLTEFADKLELVYNPHYADYGSGYSLYLGLEAAKRYHPETILFSEGDLYYPAAALQQVLAAEGDVFTVSTAPIEADKSVVVYQNEQGYYRYLFDTGHRSLCIPEPFLAVYNSAQVWKFHNPEKVYAIVSQLNQQQLAGTNLEIIGRYFGDIPPGQVTIVTMNPWLNCNTVADYDRMVAFWKGETV